MRAGRGSQPNPAVGNVVHHAGARHDRDLVADLEMPGETNLPGQGHIIPEFRAAGNADLGHDDAVGSDLHVVRDLHQVVDLAAPADLRGPERDFHVVVDDHVADLRDLVVDAGIKDITEAIGADHRSRVHPHPLADPGPGIQRDV